MTVKKRNFKQILKLVFIKNLQIPVFILFSIIFPLLFMIFTTKSYADSAFYLYKYSSFKGFADNIASSEYLLGCSIMFCALGCGLANLILVFGNSKQYNIQKIYPSLNISKTKFYLSHFIFNLIVFLVICLLLLLIYNYAIIGSYSNGNIAMFNAKQFFSFLFIWLFGYIFMFIFSVAIVDSISNFLLLIFIGLIVYVFCLLTSGTVLLPWNTNYVIAQEQHLLNPNYKEGQDPLYKYILKVDWSYAYLKWLQYWTPVGSAQRLMNIAIYDLTLNSFMTEHHINLLFLNEYKTITTYCTSVPMWQFDWIAIVAPLIQNIILFILIWKFSSWKYPKNIKTNQVKVKNVKQKIDYQLSKA